MQDYYLYYFHLGYVRTVGSYVTKSVFIFHERRAQIIWNLSFSVQIWTTLICGPKTDTDFYFIFKFLLTNVLEFLQLLHYSPEQRGEALTVVGKSCLSTS